MEKRSGVMLVLLVVLLVAIVALGGNYLAGKLIASGHFDTQVKNRIFDGGVDDAVNARVLLTTRLNHEFRISINGVHTRQYPNDLILYENLINEVQPDVIIETGTLAGGLTLYLSMVLDYLDKGGKIITVDIEPKPWEQTLKDMATATAPRKKLLEKITFVKGSSVAPDVVEQVAKLIPPNAKVLVMLDSLHTKDHVLKEMDAYSKFVNVGSYMVVNDTDLDGAIYGGAEMKGQMGEGEAYAVTAAINEWLPKNPNFVQDKSKEKYSISCVLNGILKRVK